MGATDDHGRSPRSPITDLKRFDQRKYTIPDLSTELLTDV